MEAFTKLTALAAPIDMPNVDTDQIIPARFLRRPVDERYQSYLFHDLRFNEDGSEKPDFVLNREPYRKAGIIVADRNFGCGSSREGAVYALAAFGIRSVIAPSFGDIHYNNQLKNGMLPIRLPEADCDELRRQINERPGAEIAIDLAAQTVTGPDGKHYSFEIDEFPKHCLLNGLDDIELTLQHDAAIADFEKRHRQEMDWVF